MAKPATVQKLKHGKALCGKTFGGFVDTFNWLVDFCQSLQGDKDANNANGVISVDRSDPSAPIIRNTNAGDGITVIGTDDSSEDKVTHLKFTSGTDSKVVVKISDDDGKTVATIDVYYAD